ncbi:hypothetical protein GUJ93_ZPchr0008g13808 [Zizania palustris]|uniref:Uncharacterized protein n=1 Tax=Zizania palustris TaxID=103762 RepID=A0A8J5UX43_ZIZPA|nr:hypothetical protein GUJ93_ZPchr0008g13808 [Zizania palustris]
MISFPSATRSARARTHAAPVRVTGQERAGRGFGMGGGRDDDGVASPAARAADRTTRAPRRVPVDAPAYAARPDADLRAPCVSRPAGARARRRTCMAYIYGQINHVLSGCEKLIGNCLCLAI